MFRLLGTSGSPDPPERRCPHALDPRYVPPPPALPPGDPPAPPPARVAGPPPGPGRAGAGRGVHPAGLSLGLVLRPAAGPRRPGRRADRRGPVRPDLRGRHV